MRSLVERARRGDHEAFDALARQAFGGLYAVAQRILRDREAAEDAVQECLVEAWRDIPGLRDADRFEAWIRRLLVRACYRSARRRRRRIDVAVMPADRASDERIGSMLEVRDEMERAFARLRLEHRAVLTLRYYLDLRPVEIADALSIPVGTVHSRVHYGLEALRAILEASRRADRAQVKERTA